MRRSAGFANPRGELEPPLHSASGRIIQQVGPFYRRHQVTIPRCTNERSGGSPKGPSLRIMLGPNDPISAARLALRLRGSYIIDAAAFVNSLEAATERREMIMSVLSFSQRHESGKAQRSRTFRATGNWLGFAFVLLALRS